MESIYVLPLKILAVIGTAIVIGLIIRFIRKKKSKRNSLKENLKESVEPPMPQIDRSAGFDQGVIG